MASRVVLIFGVGSNVGQSLAKAYQEKGYKVALASRKQSAKDSTHDTLYIPTDCSDTGSVLEAFSEVKRVFGIPQVVIYNAYYHRENQEAHVLEIPVEEFKYSATVNFIGAFAAARATVEGWDSVSEVDRPTFIFTGNCGNVVPLPSLMDISVGKAATAALIEIASAGYADKGYRFYYTDEREDNGSPMWEGPNAAAHAKLYMELSETSEIRTWLHTFVAGKGYKKF